MKNLCLYLFILCCFISTHTASAQVKIGDNPNTVDPSALLELEKTDKGLLVPRMTTAQRDAIGSPANSLLIFNTDDQCYNWWNATNNTWQNFGCTPTGTSVATVDCSTASVQGTYTQGTALTGSNTITITANVGTLGTYSVSASANGMVFSASGTFTTTGIQDVVLQGTGTPATSGSTVVLVSLNGGTACAVVVTVGSGVANVTGCGTAGTLVGTVQANQSIAGASILVSNIPYTSNAGTLYSLNVTANNGITIGSPNSGNFDGTSPDNLTLNFSGTPLVAGNTVLNYSINSQSCSVTVPVATGTGLATVTCGAVAGTYTAGTALGGSNTYTMTLNVTQAGTFSIRTNTVNGYYFTYGPQTLSVGAGQVITLTGVGTPGNIGMNAFTANVSNAVGTFASCNFNVTVVGTGFAAINCAAPGANYAYVKASNTEALDCFGGYYTIDGNYISTATKMSADGLTMVVGAFAESSNATGIGGNQADNSLAQSGAVYIFVRPNLTSVWTQQQYLKASNTGYVDQFGFSVDISDDGNTVIVGSRIEDSNATGVGGNQADNSATDAGAAYVFSRSSGVWTQQAYLKASNTGAYDWFGYAVAISGDGNTAAVGAHREDGSGTGINPTNNEAATDAGAAYVFTRSGGVWSPQATIKAGNTGVGDWFGYSIALSTDGNTLAVSAVYEDGSSTGVNNASSEAATNAGAAYVFIRSSGVWTQQAYVKASNTGVNDFFGISLDLSGSGDRLVVGTTVEDGSGLNINPTDNNAAADAGAAYIFARSSGVWAQQAYVKANNTGAYDYFGFSVSMSSDGLSVVVGGVLEDGNVTCLNGADNNAATDAGAAYQYTYNGSVWAFANKFKSGNIDVSDYFGYSVSQNATGTSIAIAATNEDGSGTGVNPVANNNAAGAGAVYVFTAN